MKLLVIYVKSNAIKRVHNEIIQYTINDSTDILQ